jgi:ribonuclease HI
LQNTIVIHTDGLCEPKNPGGWACWGWVALQDGQEIASGYGCLGHGPGATNNVAEYMAAIHALRWAIAQGLSEVLVRTDSQLVACQFSGAWECRSEHLRPLLAELRDLARQARARVEWVPRERNAVADALSRRAYKEARQ